MGHNIACKISRSVGHITDRILRYIDIIYRVSHKEVQVFDDVFLNIQNILFKNKFFNYIEERLT